MFKQKQLQIITAITLFIFIFVIFTIYLFQKDKTVTLEIKVTPESSLIQINQQKYKNGTHKLKPGIYQISISKPDFKSYQKTLNFKPNSHLKIYRALKTTSKTKDWYKNHPSDQSLLYKIDDFNADLKQKRKSNSDPIYKITPYDNYSSGFKISPIETKNQKPIIEIYLYTCSKSEEPVIQKNALRWLKSKNIQLKNYQIIYKSC